jgi:Flp pilus assembly protein TadD
VELNPSDAGVRQALGLFLAVGGRPDEGIAHLEKAMRFDPLGWGYSYYLHCIGLAHFAAGRYAQAVEWERRALRHHPDYHVSRGNLAASYAHLGSMDEAREALAETLRLNPALSESGIRRLFSFAEPAFLDRWLLGLRKAGWEG